MLGEANLMYATRRYKEASRLLMEVIKAAPNAADPYQTLGLVHEADGDPRRALDLYMIAAHLTPKVWGVWGGRGGERTGSEMIAAHLTPKVGEGRGGCWTCILLPPTCHRCPNDWAPPPPLPSLTITHRMYPCGSGSRRCQRSWDSTGEEGGACCRDIRLPPSVPPD